MVKHNNVLRLLLGLLLIFVIGYIGILAIHTIFRDISNDLDSSVKNEQAKYKIGEYILKEISAIETKYYMMGLVTKEKALKPIQDDILNEIFDIERAVSVLQNGGILLNYIQLNQVETNETIEQIAFVPNKDRKYTFEEIDLTPKLEELKKKVFEMEEIIKLKIAIHDSKSAHTFDNDMFKVQLFFKKLPTLFIRMKENASRLLFDSKKSLDLINKNIEKEKIYYKNLEFTFTGFIILITFILGYFLIKQIARRSDDLENITKHAKESEKEALKANEIKSQFLANMSHEIRTPLNAIIGFSDILSKSRLEDNDKEKAVVISKSASALLNIINDILDISKVESGKFEISSTDFNLNILLEQIVQLYSVNTKQKNIRFLYTFDNNIPIFINGDETRLKQVLSNLLSNAIKFTPEKGKVYFDIKLLKNEDNNIKVRFSIKDEGIGISQEDQKKIFKPFSQADGSISRRYGGTGLGLTISVKILVMLGSKIQLISKEKEGSTFFFDLDLKVQEEEKIEQQNYDYDFAVCNIIEDKENIRDHLINTLKNFGRIYENDKDIENCRKIDLIFCFGDPEFREKLTRRKKLFDAPVVFVGNKEKIDNCPQMKPLMDYYLDTPIYGSKVFNIIAESESIEKNIYPAEKQNNQKKYIGKVLVAEDNMNNQLLIKLILEDMGIDVCIVENGQLALEKYKDNDFDLVLMDINMPIMDGLTSLKHIREYENTLNKYTPIVALTANAINGDKEEYLEKGMDYYISKPIETKQLLTILDIYLKENINTEAEILPSNTDKLDVNIVSEKLGVSENIANLVINKFNLNIKTELSEFENIIENNNKEEISTKAHYLKNSCLNVCLNNVCDLLTELESSNNLNEEEIKDKFLQIKKIIDNL